MSHAHASDEPFEHLVLDFFTFIRNLLLLNEVGDEHDYGAFEDQGSPDDFPRVRVLVDLVEVEEGARRVFGDRPPVLAELHEVGGQVRGGRRETLGVTEGEIELPELDFLEHNDL